MQNLTFPDYSKNQCAIATEVLKRFGINYGYSSLDLLNQSSKKLALVLLDGFGWNLFSNLKAFHDTTALKTTSVFPSTTATALASLASGLNPAEHAIIGYKAAYKEVGSIIKPLEFTYASSNREGQLAHLGTLKEMFKITTIFDRLKQKRLRSTVITPSFISDSDYSNMIFSGASEVLGYKDIWEALFMYKQELERPRSRFVYLYIPYIDSIEHVYGHNHEISLDSSSHIFDKIANITKRYSSKVTGILTSDHGHIDIEREIDMHRDKALLKKLDLPPYGDGRAPLFKSRYDIRKELSKYNLRVFGNGDFKRLFGRIDRRVADLLPDFVGVPLDSGSYGYKYEMTPPKRTHTLKSNHGGLSQDEMEIPIVLFD